MDSKRVVRACALVTCVWLALASSAAAQFEELVRCVPRDANVLVAVNVEKVRTSALAKREGWHKPGAHGHVGF